MLTVNDHLLTCETCYQQFSHADQLEAAYTFVRANLQEVASTELDHPVYEQMAAYVDHTLSEPEIAILESHIELCAQCDVEVGDLRALKAAVYSDEAPVEKRPSGWREKLSALWRVPAYRMALQAACAVIIIGLSVWAATIPLRTRIADLEAQLGGLRQEKEQLQQDYQAAELALEALKSPPAHSVDLSQSPSPQPNDVSLNDGDGQVTLDPRGNLGGLSLLPPAYQQMVKTALTTKRVAAAAVIAKLKGESKSLMGSSGAAAPFALLGPLGTVVPGARPTLRWAALSGARGYFVTVYTPDFAEVATSPLLTETEWRVATPLKPGGVYAWQVRALKDNEEIKMPAPDAPDAKFKVLEQNRAAELERAKQAYGNSHLTLGLLYAEAGLLDQAEQEFQALSAANPNSRLAQSLLHSVKALRRK